MFRKMYQGGSSRKQGPRPAIRDADDEPPREGQVRPCEWPSGDFMVQAGIKEEFDAYVHNAELEGFMLDKRPQYYHLTDSFVRRFEFSSSRNSQTVLFDLYKNSYTMDLEDFNTACKLPQCEGDYIWASYFLHFAYPSCFGSKSPSTISSSFSFSEKFLKFLVTQNKSEQNSTRLIATTPTSA